MALKHGDKVQRARRYHKLVWDDSVPSYFLGMRRYHYEDTLSVALYGPVFRYRYDPVPGVHHYRKGRSYYRHIATVQELRWYHAHKDEVKIRAKRTPRFLPNLWDDVPYARREKGWKRTKKRKQWVKGKGGTKRLTSCSDYGIISGCDECCPALLDGNCPVPAEVLEHFMHHLDMEELNELKELYNLNYGKYKSIW